MGGLGDILAVTLVVVLAALQSGAQAKVLFSTSPASPSNLLQEGFLIGNGRLGGTFYGRRVTNAQLRHCSDPIRATDDGKIEFESWFPLVRWAFWECSKCSVCVICSVSQKYCRYHIGGHEAQQKTGVTMFDSSSRWQPKSMVNKIYVNKTEPDAIIKAYTGGNPTSDKSSNLAKIREAIFSTGQGSMFRYQSNANTY